MDPQKEYKGAYKKYLESRDRLWEIRDEWLQQEKVVSALGSLIGYQEELHRKVSQKNS